MSRSSLYRRAPSIAIALVCLCIVTPAAAQTRSWVGLVNQFWYGSPLNWSPVGAPLPGDSVFIGDLPGQENDYVYLWDIDTEITNLTLQESVGLAQSNIDLTVADTVMLSGSSWYGLEGSQGTKLVTEALVIADTAVFELTPANVGARVEVEHQMTIGPGAKFFTGGGDVYLANLAGSSGAVLVNNGIIQTRTRLTTIQAAGASTIDLDGTSGLGEVELLAETAGFGNSTLSILSPLSDAFSGTIRIGNGTTLEITNAWAADESAEVVMSGGSISGGPFTSSANMVVESAFANTIDANAVINGGTVDVANISRLIFNKTASITSDVNIDLEGKISFQGSTILDGTAVTGTGDLAFNAGLTIQGDVSLEGTTLDWDGEGSPISNSTTIDSGASLALRFDVLNSTNNIYGGLLMMEGGSLSVDVPSDAWGMNGVATLTGNNSILGDRIVVSGEMNVVSGAQDFAAPITIAGSADVSINPGTVIALSESSFAGGIVAGGGKLQLRGQTQIFGLAVIDVGELEMTSSCDVTMRGEVTVEHFTKDAAAAFNLLDGNFTISGGNAAFNSTFVFGGTGNPIARIEDGADAVVTFAWRMAPGGGDSATTVVTGTGGGRRSTLRGTGGGAGADLVVGLSGSGALVVSQGGLASFRDDFIIGQNAGSTGDVTVTGVQDGFRSTVDVTGSAGNSSVQIGGGDGGGAAAGILRIQAGALVDVSGDVIMARYPGVDSIAHLEIGGMAGGFPAELNVADDIFVGGTATTSGGEATITFNNSGLLSADEMIVWGDSTVDMSGGEMFLNTLNLSNGGDFLLAGGVLHVDLVEGQLTNTGGVISPGGSPGTTTVTGDYKHDLGASLLIELAGLAPDTEHDVFDVNSQLILVGGTLDVVLDGGFLPQAGDRFDILDFDTIMGAFAIVNLPSLPSALAWDATDLYSMGELSVVGASLSADFDEDGDVDGDDLDVWTKFYAQTEDADADDDGDSDGRDFLEWQRQYTGAAMLVAGFAAPAVPEPSAATTVSLAVLNCLVGWRRLCG